MVIQPDAEPLWVLFFNENHTHNNFLLYNFENSYRVWLTCKVVFCKKKDQSDPMILCLVLWKPNAYYICDQWIIIGRQLDGGKKEASYICNSAVSYKRNFCREHLSVWVMISHCTPPNRRIRKINEKCWAIWSHMSQTVLTMSLQLIEHNARELKS